MPIKLWLETGDDLRIYLQTVLDLGLGQYVILKSGHLRRLRP